MTFKYCNIIARVSWQILYWHIALKCAILCNIIVPTPAWSIILLHRYNRELLQKLVPREGDEKGGSKVMGISLGQVMKGQEYRSIHQVKKRRSFFFYQLLYTEYN